MFTIFILLCLALIALGHYGPKWLIQWQRVKDEELDAQKDYRDRTVRALERLSSTVPDVEIEEERSTLDSFLEGNKKILEKSQVRHAMKTELGID